MDALLDPSTELSFLRACSAWDGRSLRLDQSDASHPTQFFELWGGGRCALLEYAAAVEGELSSLAGERLDQLADLSRQQHLDRATECLKLKLAGTASSVAQPVAQQLAHLVTGIIHGVRAACRLRGWSATRPDEPPDAHAVDDLLRAMQGYDAAWPLHGGTVNRIAGCDASRTRDERSLALFDSIVRAKPGSGLANQRDAIGKAWNRSAFLIVQRLLAYVFAEPFPALPFRQPFQNAGGENEITTLLVQQSGQGWQGRLLPVTISCHDAGDTGLCLDPLAWGATVLDDRLLESLRVAERLALDHSIISQHHRQGIESPLSLRVAPRFGACRDVWSIAGASAGGIFTAGLVATASGHRLNRDVTASFEFDLTEAALDSSTITPNAHRISPVDPPSVCAKIAAYADARRASTAGAGRCGSIFLSQEQTAGGPLPAPAAWDDWVPEWEQATGLLIRPAATLGDVIDALTGDERMERVLEAYCQQVAGRWERRRSDERDSDFLTHYIPPSFSKKVHEGAVLDTSERQRGGVRDGAPQTKDPYEPVSPRDADEQTRFRELFALNDRLVVTEDAGAGKSVFTRRAAAWFATPAAWEYFFEGRPALPFRWERLDKDWPTTFEQFREHILEALVDVCREGVQPADVLDYAFREGRVVYLCDAFDQATAAGQRLAFQQFVRWLDDQHPQNRVIVTSRARAYADAPEGLFSTQRWTLCRLEGFSPWQQLRYLRDLLETSHGLDGQQRDEWVTRIHMAFEAPAAEQEGAAERILASPPAFGVLYSTIGELLKVPVVLAFVRVLARGKTSFPQFANRADLYFQVTDFLFDRNLQKDPETSAKVHRHKLELRELLAAIGMEMTLCRAGDYVVRGEEAVATLENAVRRRINNAAILGKWSDLWELVERLAVFTGRLMVEQKSKDHFGWKHLGMMEFYAGLHLARYAAPDLAGELAAHAGNPQWYWPWRFAIELADLSRGQAFVASQSLPLLGSLKALYGRPQGQPRPGELICRSWPWVMEQAGLFTPPAGEAWVGAWYDALMDATDRAQRVVRSAVQQGLAAGGNAFDDDDVLREAYRTLHGQPAQGVVPATRHSQRKAAPAPGPVKLAAVGVLYEFLCEYPLILGGAEGAGDLPANAAQVIVERFENGFRRCPGPNPQQTQEAQDREWQQLKEAARTGEKHPLLHCWMGDDSRLTYQDEPVHVADVRGPFWMHEYPMTNDVYRLYDAQHENDALYSPEDLCPVIRTDTFDEWTCALWFHSRIPDEIEWECAARAQRWEPALPPIRELYWFGITTDRANALSNDELNQQVALHAWIYTNSGDKANPVGHAGHTNGWGLCDMSGNVYERTCSGPSDDSRHTMRVGPPAAINRRVLRGGFWGSDARSARSASRGWNSPVNRSLDVGFRLSRTP